MAKRKARPAAYERSERRNAEVRATLHPLAPSERPRPLLVAVAVAVALAVANLAIWASGYEVNGRDPGFLGAALFAAVMLAAAWGMWHQRYWAVLGFEALLGIAVSIFALSLLVASNAAAVAICLAVVLLGGWLFWKLVRVMARMQAPTRPR